MREAFFTAYTLRKRRELLSMWLWDMYERACHEKKPEQARAIANILARMTRHEHEITR